MEMRERRPGEGTGQCCYETREEDEEEERSERGRWRGRGEEGGVGRASSLTDLHGLLDRHSPRRLSTPFLRSTIKILLRFHKTQTAAS